MRYPNILIVDDTLENLDLLVTLLKGQNYEIHRASDAQMAIEFVQNNHPDLIVMDVVLPDLSGYEVCQYLKSQKDLKDIPIIFISALDTPSEKVRAFECGGSDYITEPFFIAEVIVRIENQLKIKELQSNFLMQNSPLIQNFNHRQETDKEILNNLLKAQELNRLKSQFIFTISHEFKTPLTTIQLATDLLSHYQLSPDQREERYQQIKSSIFYMNTLLENTIFTEQLNNNTIDLEFKSVGLNNFFHNTIEPFRNMLSDNHTLIITMPEEEKEVRINTTLVCQIVSNLVSNAIKYSPHGGKIWIDLSCQRDQILDQVSDQTSDQVLDQVSDQILDQVSDQIIFKVKDQGIGIPEDDQHQLFELFSRGSNISTIRGAGLGLAIVYRSVEFLQGNLTFTSTVGVGTEFIVTIPYTLSASASG